MGAKKTDEFYSLLNVTNGNILSARLNTLNWYNKDKPIKRQRNWSISQFQAEDSSILDYFINGISITTNDYDVGVHEIWVREEDIDMLYAVLAIAVLRHFCSCDKQKALFGAFLFHKNPELFIAEDFVGTRNSSISILKRLKCGKEFMEFLESFGVLSYAKNKRIYLNGKYVNDEKERYFFSSAELDLVKRQRKDIITSFEKVNNESV